MWKKYKMPTKLPIIKYKNKSYFVDFRLEELRNIKTAKSIPFTKLEGGVNSSIKKKLRALRFRKYSQYYMPGLDN